MHEDPIKHHNFFSFSSWPRLLLRVNQNLAKKNLYNSSLVNNSKADCSPVAKCVTCVTRVPLHPCVFSFCPSGCTGASRLHLYRLCTGQWRTSLERHQRCLRQRRQHRIKRKAGAYFRVDKLQYIGKGGGSTAAVMEAAVATVIDMVSHLK